MVLAGSRGLHPSEIVHDASGTRGRTFRADKDGDGDLDRLTAFGRGQHLVWQENLGDDTFARPQLAITEPLRLVGVHSIDLNRDGTLDVLRCVYNKDLVVWNTHAQSMMEPASATAFVRGVSSPTAVESGDVDGDGNLEVLISTFGDGTVSWYEVADTEGRLQAGSQHVLDSDLPGATDVMMANLDESEGSEIIAVAHDAGKVCWYANLGGGEFGGPHVLDDSLTRPKKLDVWDIDGDGRMDVLIAAEDEIVWYRNLGDGRFAGAEIVTTLDGGWTRAIPSNVAVADPEAGRILGRWNAHTDHVTSVAVSPNDEHVATVGHDHVIRIWKLESGQFIRAIATGDTRVKDLQFSPDGEHLLAAVGDNVRIWNARAFVRVGELVGHENAIERIDVSADGSIVATASQDLSVRLWSLPEGRELRVLLGHQYPPRAIAFSDDGRRIATGAERGAVRIWDVGTGQELLTLRDSELGIRDLGFRDERTLVAIMSRRWRDGRTRTAIGQWRAD